MGSVVAAVRGDHGRSPGRWALPAMVLLTATASSNTVAVKLAVESWQPLLLGAVRMTLVGALFWSWLRLGREPTLPSGVPARRDLFAAAAAKAFGLVGFYLGLAITRAVEAAVVQSLSPLVAVTLAHFLLADDRLSTRKVAGLALGAAGVLLLLDGSHGTAAGNALVLTSVIGANLMTVFEKRALEGGATPRQLALWNCVASLAVLAPASRLLGETTELPRSATAWWMLGYLVTVCGVGLFFARRWLLGRLPVSYIASFSHLGRILTVLYGALLLGERLDAHLLTALALVLAGVAVGPPARPSTSAPAQPFQDRVP